MKELIKSFFSFLKSVFKSEDGKAPIIKPAPDQPDPNLPPPEIIDQEPEVVIIDPSLPTIGEVDRFVPDISRYEPCDFSDFNGDDLIFKATDGDSWVDPEFARHLRECKARGIKTGVYHFYRVGPDPIVQAKHFIKAVGLENLKSMYYEPILDYETVTNKKVGPIQLEPRMKADIPDAKIFLRYIYEQTGRKCMFYTYESLLKYLQLDNEFKNLCSRLWLARYSRALPTYFKPWDKPFLYQYSDGEWSSNPLWNDNFKGIGRCDANIFWDRIKE